MHETCLKKKGRERKTKKSSIKHQSECFSNSNNLKSIHLINSKFQLCGGEENKILFYSKKLFDKINDKIVSVEKQKVESISGRNSLWYKKKKSSRGG